MESERSPIVAAELTAARTSETVISPPKSERFCSSARAAAVPSTALAETVAKVESAETIEPSEGVGKRCG